MPPCLRVLVFLAALPGCGPDVARFPEAIYVLHAFEKKTRRTRQTDINLARQRFRDLERVRSRRRYERSMSTRVHRSSGNVFRDVGFDVEEAENRPERRGASDG